MEEPRDFRKEILSFHSYGNEYHIRLDYTSYRNNGTLALQMMDRIGPDEEEPFAVATVNLPESSRLAVNEQFVDTNNVPGIAEWLTCTGVATPTGRTARSGFCEYPVFAFNLPAEVERQIISSREDAIAEAVIKMMDDSNLSPVECTERGDRYHIAEGTDIILYRGGTDRNLGDKPDVFLLASSSKHKDKDMWRLRNLPQDVRKAVAEDIRAAAFRSQSAHLKMR